KLLILWRLPKHQPLECLRERTALLHEGVLIVVELDIRLVGERDVEREGKVSSRGLMEAESGPPAPEIALEGERMVGELACGEVIRGIPGRAPVPCRTEREIHGRGLSTGDITLLRRRIGPAARARERDAQREASAPAQSTHAEAHTRPARPVRRARPSLIAPKVVGASCRRSAGRR